MTLINAYLDVMRLESGVRTLRREAVALEATFAYLSAVVSMVRKFVEVSL